MTENARRIRQIPLVSQEAIAVVCLAFVDSSAYNDCERLIKLKALLFMLVFEKDDSSIFLGGARKTFVLSRMVRLVRLSAQRSTIHVFASQANENETHSGQERKVRLSDTK